MFSTIYFLYLCFVKKIIGLIELFLVHFLICKIIAKMFISDSWFLRLIDKNNDVPFLTNTNYFDVSLTTWFIHIHLLNYFWVADIYWIKTEYEFERANSQTLHGKLRSVLNVLLKWSFLYKKGHFKETIHTYCVFLLCVLKTCVFCSDI
jgi:hypothetical protein